jgi:hypothetical protein
VQPQQIYVDLGKNYSYLTTGGELDYSGYAGNAVFAYKNQQAIPVVFPRIEKYKFNDSYITVKQKFDGNEISELLQTIFVFNVNENFYLGGIDTALCPVYDSLTYNHFKNYYEQKNSLLNAKEYSDSIVAHSEFFRKMRNNQYNFYIIDKGKGLKYGPFSANEFYDKMEKMRIPDSLKL